MSHCGRNNIWLTDYSLNLKPWSARTLFVYAHVDLAQKYSVGLQEIFVCRLCSQEENCFFLSRIPETKILFPISCQAVWFGNFANYIIMLASTRTNQLSF
jgi:hypothetical protein